MIAHPYRTSPTAGRCPRSPWHEEWGRNPVGGPRPVETIQILLIGGEGGEKTVLLSQGGGPGFPLMRVFVSIPGVVRLEPVLRTGPVRMGLRLIPSVVTGCQASK